jgi:hypothetical protein
MWEELAKNFFNSPTFAPHNPYTHDERLADIDPSKAPSTPWSGSQLRKQVASIRGELTKVSANFKKSGQIAEGADHGEGDDEIYYTHAAALDKEFKWSRNVFLYIYLVYGRSPQQWYMRDLPRNLQLDVGIKESTAVPSSSQVSRQRKKESQVDYPSLKEALAPSDVEVKLLEAQLIRENAAAAREAESTRSLLEEGRRRELAHAREEAKALRDEMMEREAHILQRVKLLNTLMDDVDCTPELKEVYKAKKLQLLQLVSTLEV